MPEIRQLPTSVVNKIAAGEVIERPASVVKELVENSVDAGATRIDVTVTQGGTDSITIADNGCGIRSNQLSLAVASHATSKLRDADDLFRVTTLGFRGEALASIAEVSQFRIRSRTGAESAGAELEIYGGQPNPVAPCGCPVGTSIQVRNLFFNTPVRRKFMRTVQTEMGHVAEAFTRIALPHTQIHFTLTHNERNVYDLAPTDDGRSRVGAIFGQDLADSLIEVEAEAEGIRIHGYVADPSQNRANNRMQYLFLNHRHIRDRSLSHALSEAYRGLLMTGRFAIAFLHLELPAESVDVNVHPTKMEVRFQDGGKIYSQLLGMLRSRFLSTDLTAKARLDDARQGTTGDRVDGSPPSLGLPLGSRPGFSNRDQVSQWANAQSGQVPPFQQYPGDSTGGFSSGMGTRQSSLDLDFSGATASRQDGPRSDASPFEVDGTRSSSAWASPTVTPEGTPAMQVYNRYLITETDEGVVIIDQHALHERILYEEIRTKVLDGAMEMQRLLVPEPVPLTAEEAATILDHRETIEKLGMEVEPFGNDTILVSSYPAMLANLNPGEILRQIAERLMTPGKVVERRDLLDELLHMISCKAAIKAGDRLTPDEIHSLIARRHVVQDAHHCPHGRPTTLVFSRDELDKRFKRI